MSNIRRRLNPAYGIAVFIIIELLFIFVFAPLQYYFGMLGLALTELGLLTCTLLAVKATGQSFREVFPIRKPKFGQIMGTLLIWASCLLLTMLTTLILMYFFPEGYLQVSSSMNSVFATVPAPVRLFIVAVMPAICEEAMHRGYIQYSFQSVRSDWIIILSMGLIFGLFHMDPYRFLPTALLGIGLSYVMQKTHNIFLPALYHFINNFLSLLSSLGTSTEALEQSTELLANRSYILVSIGSYLMIGAFAPILLFAGSHLLRKASGSLPRRTESRTVATAVVLLVLYIIMTISGLALMLFSMLKLPEMQEMIQNAEIFM
ncbi:type II CAAX endopeptidase family protein [Lachnoclostridium sp. An131]|uniref:type II CAAX endopeptidase family protein n=1 Tax=Lachnoclostridium sp. An131 TaxID=1965555 RepID=UPI0013A618FE|nr:type II CAAX endopeptidase family protein [Lachnoclostridium sp. An131]